MRRPHLFPAAAALALLACGGAPPPSPARPSRIILVSVDTLRADHLGCYGYRRDTSPHIDHFRKDAVLFREAIAPSASTLASHASILTALAPQHHGASFAARTPVADTVATLAEVLRAHGFRTAAYTGGGQLDPIFGVGRGFEVYEMPRNNQSFESVVMPGLYWIDQHREEPVFVFLHTYEVHHPYGSNRRVEVPPAPGDEPYRGTLPPSISVETIKAINEGRLAIDEHDLAHIVRAYDSDIRSMDARFGRLVIELQKYGLYDSSLIVLTADHGEEFDEHGKVGWHGHTLYDELLRVPLLIKFPGQAFAGLEVESPVRSIDIAPTILDAAGVPIPEGFSGTSLLGYLAEPRGPGRGAVCWLDAAAAVVEAYRERPWKLYGSGLFDLGADPGETTNVARENGARRRDLEEKLAAEVASRPRPGGAAVEASEETTERLRSLGYVE